MACEGPQNRGLAAIPAAEMKTSARHSGSLLVGCPAEHKDRPPESAEKNRGLRGACCAGVRCSFSAGMADIMAMPGDAGIWQPTSEDCFFTAWGASVEGSPAGQVITGGIPQATGLQLEANERCKASTSSGKNSGGGEERCGG